MNICVISPEVSGVSAKKLAKKLNADYSNPFKEDRRDYKEYDLVFNYGCNRRVQAKKIINHPNGVANCIDKLRTYNLLHNAGIPTINYVKIKDEVLNSWKMIVARKEKDGSGGQDLTYHNRNEKLPDALFYTEYYAHNYELRIMVLNGEVIGRFLKKDKRGETEFVEIDEDFTRLIDEQCILATKALGIDYVGFDVLSVNDSDFIILEANSGPILPDGVWKEIEKRII